MGAAVRRARRSAVRLAARRSASAGAAAIGSWSWPLRARCRQQRSQRRWVGRVSISPAVSQTSSASRPSSPPAWCASSAPAPARVASPSATQRAASGASAPTPARDRGVRRRSVGDSGIGVAGARVWSAGVSSGSLASLALTLPVASRSLPSASLWEAGITTRLRSFGVRTTIDLATCSAGVWSVSASSRAVSDRGWRSGSKAMP